MELVGKEYMHIFDPLISKFIKTISTWKKRFPKSIQLFYAKVNKIINKFTTKK